MEKCNGLNVIYTNTDVLHNKLEELELTAKNEKADIIAVTEILLKNMPPFTKPEDFVFKIKGFTTIHNYNGRGLCLFIKDGINHTQVFEYESFKTSIFVNIPSSNGNLTLGVLYRSPNSSPDENHELVNVINSISKKHLSLKKRFLLLGDFNFPGINWENETTNHVHDSLNMEVLFLNSIHDNFLHQMVTEPTHTRNMQNTNPNRSGYNKCS